VKPSRMLVAGAWHAVERGELIHTLETIAEKAAVTVKGVRSTIATPRPPEVRPPSTWDAWARGRA